MEVLVRVLFSLSELFLFFSHFDIEGVLLVSGFVEEYPLFFHYFFDGAVVVVHGVLCHQQSIQRTEVCQRLTGELHGLFLH